MKKHVCSRIICRSVLLTATLFYAAGCGFQLRTLETRLINDGTKLHIGSIYSQGFAVGNEELLTELLEKEISRRSGLTLSELEGADMIISASIRSYSEEIVNNSITGRNYNLNIRTSISLQYWDMRSKNTPPKSFTVQASYGKEVLNATPGAVETEAAQRIVFAQAAAQIMDRISKH